MGCLVGIIILTFITIVLYVYSLSPVLGGIFLVLLIGSAIYFGNLNNKKQSKMINDKINKLFEMEKQVKDFTVSQKYQSDDIQSAILLDEERKKVCFIYANNDLTEIYDYKDILESEILEDGKTITTTSKTSQIGGAIIGGVIAGSVGAIVGGLSGKQSSELEVYNLDLKVVVNNTKSPNKIMNFLTSGVNLSGESLPIKKDSSVYKIASSNANHWHSLLSLLIKQDDQISLEKKQELKIDYSRNISVADEIKKLSELLNQGLLTHDEFNASSLFKMT